VKDDAVLFVADAEDLIEGLALGKLDHRVIELAAADEVEDGALVRARSGSVVTGGPTNAILMEGLAALMASARR